MKIALRLAESARGQTTPNPLVGAVIVRDGRIVGVGAHLYAGGPHAEINALNMAGDKAVGSTVYVTLEPCSHYGKTPPCANALVEANVERVIIAVQDPNPEVSGAGIQRLRNAGIEVEVGVLEAEARALNSAFFCWIRKDRPLIVWKAAATLDGYIAAETGDSRYVTGPEARHAVHALRRRIPAIAVGVQTIITDNPQLTDRFGNSQQRQPLRVVFDSTLRTPVSAKVLQEPGQTLFYTTERASPHRTHALEEVNPGNVKVVALPSTPEGHVPLQEALTELSARGINELLVEGGATIVSQLLRQQLIDELVYFVAPKILGGGIPVLAGLGPTLMTDAVSVQNVTWEQIGPDLCLRGTLKYDDV
ncbi:bifunctional diaminohydroxyphosphoribosylaminopyrimidine deaminase/5-amino-6-(5-phosphoribosylamino)uracil reductase RibD [Alicyclobacillus sp. SO9]|nr:bifunctional diaminohydroxyphosphoribosylaminopyrimidine deaminase/5-amino-6-(5-phosphoribosylamino)uracil reductase RibD [Alicyclobacillus sp. SO9]